MRTVFFLPLLTALQEGGVREGGGGGGTNTAKSHRITYKHLTE